MLLGIARKELPDFLREGGIDNIQEGNGDFIQEDSGIIKAVEIPQTLGSLYNVNPIVDEIATEKNVRDLRKKLVLRNGRRKERV